MKIPDGFIYSLFLTLFLERLWDGSIQENLKKELVLNSLNMAYKNKSGFPAGIIFHSDKGSQHSSNEVRKYLKLKKRIDTALQFSYKKRGQIFYCRIY